MSKNILWQNLSAREIQKMIQDWVPQNADKTKTEILVEEATKTKHKIKNLKVSKVKPLDLTGMPSKRQKHTGLDGEVRYIDHRDQWLGFFGGRAVLARKTEESCRKALKDKFGVSELIKEH